jgi:hypothetical protein
LLGCVHEGQPVERTREDIAGEAELSGDARDQCRRGLEPERRTVERRLLAL